MASGAGTNSNTNRPDAAAPALPEPERAPAGAMLLEVSWEVCNQLGGIYQVIRSKAPLMGRRWRQRYALIGPYNPQKAAVEFEAKRAPAWMQRAIDHLAAGADGAPSLKVHYGRWLIPGRPKVLLVEHGVDRARLGALKYTLYTDHGVETPGSGDIWFIDGAVTFGDATRRLAVALAREWLHARAAIAAAGVEVGEAAEPHTVGLSDDDEDLAAAEADAADDAAAEVGGSGGADSRRIILHAHEWMAGLAIPALRKHHADLPIATVFTTHATQLGRSLAWGTDALYDHLPWYNEGAEARKLNIAPQHYIERAAAHAAHVFTTVSPITGEECTHLLGRTPDMILPNGLNIEHYNVGHEFQTFHGEFKQRIHEFTMGHFFPSYSFDLDDTLYFFTSGRFEPRNKGFDLCLEALARLNAELKSARAKGEPGGTRNVVFFVITQRSTRSINPACLQSRGVLNELREVCDSITRDIGEQLYRKAAAREPIDLDAMVSEYWNLRFRRTQHAMTTDRLPMVVTHVLEDEAKDEVLNQIRNLWLFNRPEDPVKIVYHPEFISPTNPLWGLEYDQFVRGCHMGIFPSAYEPWGYTPLECLAMGVPAVTSDLSGFGRYIQQTHPEMETPSGGGLYMLRRRGRSFHDAAADLARHLLDFCRLDRRSRIAMRNEVEQRSWDFDWSRLGRAYDWAHDLAMARVAAGEAGL